jgi:hypothetical protein
VTARPAPAPSARSARTKHCVWCGESLPGSRALFHYCGSKDRPVTNCARSLPNLGSDLGVQSRPVIPNRP